MKKETMGGNKNSACLGMGVKRREGAGLTVSRNVPGRHEGGGGNFKKGHGLSENTASLRTGGEKTKGRAGEGGTIGGRGFGQTKESVIPRMRGIRVRAPLSTIESE